MLLPFPLLQKTSAGNASSSIFDAYPSYAYPCTITFVTALPHKLKKHTLQYPTASSVSARESPCGATKQQGDLPQIIFVTQVIYKTFIWLDMKIKAFIKVFTLIKGIKSVKSVKPFN